MRLVMARPLVLGLLFAAALSACGDEPEYGRWTQSDVACPGPDVDTVAFGSDFIEFHIADSNVTERIDAVVDSDRDRLVVHYYNEVVEPMGTFAWTLHKVDDTRMERVHVAIGSGHQFVPLDGEPVMFYACP